MKNILKISVYILTSFCVLVSCNSDNQLDEPQEDYEKLFPWKGIDKPESAYEDMTIEPCNDKKLNKAIEEYKKNYGKDVETRPYRRTYSVTVTITFKEGYKANFIGKSKYEITYIDANKTFKHIGTKSNQEGIVRALENGENYTETFEVESGYPFYLSVKGVGGTGSNIKAKIVAKEKYGLIDVPVLKTEKYQPDNAGLITISPYCQYIILP